MKNSYLLLLATLSLFLFSCTSNKNEVVNHCSGIVLAMDNDKLQFQSLQNGVVLSMDCSQLLEINMPPVAGDTVRITYSGALGSSENPAIARSIFTVQKKAKSEIIYDLKVDKKKELKTIPY